MKMRITPGMKTATVLLIFLIGGSSIFAQTRTINSAGTWSNSGIWQAGNIADVITEDVSIAQNTGVITVGADYTIGAVDMNNGNTLTINSGAHLDVGQAGTPKNFTVGNTGTINVVGTLIIWGDLIISNTLDLNVSPGGILIVKGNVTLGNGGDINISGNVVIGGNFSAGTNTNAVIDGNVAVGGTIAVGNGSTASGTGTVTAIGCSDGGGVFCSASVMSVMPIKLLYFNAKLVDDAAVSLSWATSKEEDFDHFELERANNNLKFSKITEVAGAGYNTEDRQEYTWLDSNPYTGENYYRLKAVDLDGSFEYFKIVSAASSANKRFSIFPNPTNDKSVNYSTNFDFSGNDRIIVMDNMGNLFQQASVSSIEGKLVLSENVKPGLFFVKYVSDNFTQTVRLMVR